MNWLAENWFLVMLLVVFLGMHLFGHGCGYGGHGGRRGRRREHDPEAGDHPRKEQAAHGCH